MKKIILLTIAGTFLLSCHSNESDTDPLVTIKQYLIEQTDSLIAAVTQMEVDAGKKSPHLHQSFADARKYFKHTEALSEFYFPGISKVINGPAIDKLEVDDSKVIDATGFQVIEEMIYPEPDWNQSADLLTEIGILKGAVGRLRMLHETNTLTDENVFEAVRLEVLRILSLGISGFDSPVSLQSLKEAKASLEGIRDIAKAYQYKGKTAYEKLDALLRSSVAYLLKDNDFSSFDRAAFIVDFLNPLSAELRVYQEKLQIKNNKWLIAVDLTKDDFFAPGVFNRAYFSPDSKRSTPDTLIHLGRTLFFDPVVSGNNSRSCASCHLPERAFSDARPKSVAFDFKGHILRNAPTLVNAGFQQSMFWDGRLTFLEDQVNDVVSNPFEMHGNLSSVVDKIDDSEDYQKLFASAFQSTPDSAITHLNIQVALAWYIRSLEGMNSKFDRYMRGEKGAMNSEEIRGFNLFMGKAKCGTCHFAPLFNGTIPPMYSDSESEVLGVPGNADTVNAVPDTDRGRYHLYEHPFFDGMFKTPTVRNAALTPPYMHNGIYNTLEEVIDFYNRGGGVGLGLDVPHQTLPPDKLHLTPAEKKDLISFIHALNDTTGLTLKPSALPEIKNIVLAKRKVGGSY